MGIQESFAHFGAMLTNKRWSWSARTLTGDVVLAVWDDGFDWRQKPVLYKDFSKAWLDELHDRPGNRERIENLIWARDHHEGLFNVVLVIAENRTHEPRKVRESHPVSADRWRMRLVELDEVTGQFTAEVVTQKAKQPHKIEERGRRDRKRR